MTLHDQIHAECCDGCKGLPGRESCCCYETCAGYHEEYAEIEAEWLKEKEDGPQG